MSRILIAGGPRTGKTTLAYAIAAEKRIPVLHTDDLIETHGWSEASAEVARWMQTPGPWIIEGTAVPRALRKWQAAHPGDTPADVVHWLDKPKVTRTPGQNTMAKGTATVWREVEPSLKRLGVPVAHEIKQGASRADNAGHSEK